MYLGSCVRARACTNTDVKKPDQTHGPLLRQPLNDKDTQTDGGGSDERFLDEMNSELFSHKR